MSCMIWDWNDPSAEQSSISGRRRDGSPVGGTQILGREEQRLGRAIGWYHRYSFSTFSI